LRPCPAWFVHLGVVHIPKKLTADLWRWKQQCPDPSPQAFIFPNKDGDFMDTSNYRKRVLHKLATDLGLPKLTFQVIRRTIATLAQKKGTVKDVQGPAPALARSNHDGRLHAGDSEERAGDGRLDQCGVEKDVKVCAAAESKSP
jgi:integrase